MFLWGRSATVATPPETEHGRNGNAVTTSPTSRQLAELSDEVVWLKERFEKLQLKVTGELREIRRLLDDLEDAYVNAEDEDQR